jgi:hypothetical protein
MQYRVVYDVLNDGFPWFAVAFTVVPLLIAIACILEIIRGVRRKQPAPAPRVPGGIPLVMTPLLVILVFVVVLGFAGVYFALQTYQGFVQRQRCRERVRTGQYQVVEGTIADYHYRKAGSSFRVADQSFDLLNAPTSFTGSSLANGMQVRLTHREGTVLRVEIAAGKKKGAVEN